MRSLLLTVVCSQLILAGCERPADTSRPKHFQDGGISFDYPGNWKITKNETLSSGRLFFLETTGSAVFVLTVYNSGLDIALEDYAENFRKSLGEKVPFHLLKHPDMAAADAGIDCKYSLLDVPHTANITKHVFGEITVICVSQVADEDRNLVTTGFALVRRTLNSSAAEKSKQASAQTP